MTHDTGREEGLHRRRGLLRVVRALFLVLLIVASVNVFIAQPRTVEGGSMEPTLQQGEGLLVEMLSYRLRAPERGEIIVLELAAESTGPMVKRVIGLPGEIVAIHAGRVHVNDQPLEEPYLLEATGGLLPPTLVPEDHLFVLGDNRGESDDSRHWGMVPYQDIIGRACFRYWPLSRIGILR